MFLWEIFQTQTIDGWPNPTRATKNWPDLTRVKNFDPDPSLKGTQFILTTLGQKLLDVVVTHDPQIS